MNFNEIQELIKLVNKSNVAEFKMKDKDFELLIRTEKYHKGVPQAFVTAPQLAPVVNAAPAIAVSSTHNQSAEETNLNTPTPLASPSKSVVEIKSPIVGTFYRSSSQDKPPLVKVGDPVKQGDVVCIIEAMKLFNEIESDITGTIVKVLVEDASPVEYDQVLFLVEI